MMCGSVAECFRCWTCDQQVTGSVIIIISLRFNGYFPGEPGLAGVDWSKGWWQCWWQLEL